MTALESARVASEKLAPGVTVREVGDKLVYTDATGQDLFARKGVAITYLKDFPKWKHRAGDLNHLSDPFDESAATTARDLVNGPA
jgi:hypothetical protein